MVGVRGAVIPSFSGEAEWRNNGNGEKQIIKNHLSVVYTTLLIIDFILVFPWYPEWDLNPHSANAEGF